MARRGSRSCPPRSAIRARPLHHTWFRQGATRTVEHLASGGNVGSGEAPPTPDRAVAQRRLPGEPSAGRSWAAWSPSQARTRAPSTAVEGAVAPDPACWTVPRETARPRRAHAGTAALPGAWRSAARRSWRKAGSVVRTGKGHGPFPRLSRAGAHRGLDEDSHQAASTAGRGEGVGADRPASTEEDEDVADRRALEKQDGAKRQEGGQQQPAFAWAPDVPRALRWQSATRGRGEGGLVGYDE